MSPPAGDWHVLRSPLLAEQDVPVPTSTQEV